MIEKSRKDPMDRLAAARAAPRCGAKTRRATVCQSAAMANGRCQMHGGKSTGPRTVEGLERIKAARLIHGNYGAEMVELRKRIRDLKRTAKKLGELVS